MKFLFTVASTCCFLASCLSSQVMIEIENITDEIGKKFVGHNGMEDNWPYEGRKGTLKVYFKNFFETTDVKVSMDDGESKTVDLITRGNFSGSKMKVEIGKVHGPIFGVFESKNSLRGTSTFFDWPKVGKGTLVLTAEVVGGESTIEVSNHRLWA